MTNQELFEADRCFDWVCGRMRAYDLPWRSVLFGSTLKRWLDGDSDIVIACEPPARSLCFVRASLEGDK